MGRLWSEFAKAFWRENPVLRLVLGMCPTLAVTTAAINGIGMGLATTVVLLMSNVLISLLRNIIPRKIRIPCFIVVIASFVTIVDYTMAALVPPLHEALGIFIPLIVVNCVILGRAEAFASKNTVLYSFVDGLGMGLAFTVTLTILAAGRELLGAGTIFGAAVMGTAYKPAIMMILPPGAFLGLGLMMGAMNWWDQRIRKAELEERKEAVIHG